MKSIIIVTLSTVVGIIMILAALLLFMKSLTSVPDVEWDSHEQMVSFWGDDFLYSSYFEPDNLLRNDSVSRTSTRKSILWLEKYKKNDLIGYKILASPYNFAEDCDLALKHVKSVGLGAYPAEYAKLNITYDESHYLVQKQSEQYENVTLTWDVFILGKTFGTVYFYTVFTFNNAQYVITITLEDTYYTQGDNEPQVSSLFENGVEGELTVSAKNDIRKIVDSIISQ